MSGAPPGPPGPGARNMSVGNGPPSAGLPPQGHMPPQQSNAPPPPSASNTPQSQQNLNQIVLEYLSKKGYHRTEAMLRKESEPEPPPAGFPPPEKLVGGPRFTRAFELLRTYVEDNLDLYKPELKRLLWPVFVYSHLILVRDHYIKDGEAFFAAYREMFANDHKDDVAALSVVTLSGHVVHNRTAKLYMENRYRLSLSTMAFYNLVQFLEAKAFEGGNCIMEIIRDHMNIVSVDRPATGAERNIASILARAGADSDLPAEDEGIPGHNPGHPSTSKHDADVDSAGRIRLMLGPYPQDADLQEDVRATLEEEDAKNPPERGQNTLVEEYDQLIKREPTDEVPSRDTIPIPPSLARDVAMEVQKVIEHRDRFKLLGRTGGTGPGVSVCMYTFHNTFDSINCIDFSGDTMMVAAGSNEAYIRVWSLDGNPLPSLVEEEANSPPSSSRRLIGHAGPVFAVSFSPAIANPNPDGPKTNAQLLLSCSEDKTIRLWSLEAWACLVAYRGHDAPVWDVQWGPHGHYFLSGSLDRTGRLWSTDHPAAHKIFVGHDSDVDVVAWHPNNLYCFTGSNDRTIRMWHVGNANCLRLFTGHPGNITALACSPDGKTFASADDIGNIILWDLESGRRKKRMRGHGKGGIWSLSWSVESTVLVSGGADKTVRVWDVLQETTESAAKPGAEGSVVGAAADKGKGPAGSSGAGGKKAAKEVGVSPDQIAAFPTKHSPVYKVLFTRMNLVLAGSAYLPPNV